MQLVKKNAGYKNATTAIPDVSISELILEGTISNLHTDFEGRYYTVIVESILNDDTLLIEHSNTVVYLNESGIVKWMINNGYDDEAVSDFFKDKWHDTGSLTIRIPLVLKVKLQKIAELEARSVNNMIMKIIKDNIVKYE